MSKTGRPIKEAKKKEVEKIKQYIKKYKCFGIINMESLPSAQLQKMRSQLKPGVFITMSKKRLINLALEQLKGEKQNLNDIIESIKGIPALLFTNEDPFKIYRIIEKSKTSASARSGQIAPHDIMLQAGPTPFTPGPIIGELGQLGIKTEVKEGKVAVKEDKILVKENQVINEKIASLLSKLGIQPMEIGLNITAIYENGIIYKKAVLSIDEKKVVADMKKITMEAIMLALELGYANKDTINLLIGKAYKQANALAEKTNVNGG